MAIDPVMQDLNRELAKDEAAELFGYAVDAVLARWMGDRAKVAETIDEHMATSGHVPEGATLLAWFMAAFVKEDSERNAVAFVEYMRTTLRERLRPEAEELVRANDARLEAEGGDA